MPGSLTWSRDAARAIIAVIGRTKAEEVLLSILALDSVPNRSVQVTLDRLTDAVRTYGKTWS